MTTWHEYVQRTGTVPEWRYPLRYDVINEVETDVLVLGGGIAGSHAAINAARQGARVALVEKGATKRSGMGGAGVDHWLCACTNPCSQVTPEQFTDAWHNLNAGWNSAIVRYITAREAWDTLLDCERMGVQIRDVNDEFKGAPFRDESTKLLFAYDYQNRHNLRVWGHDMKPKLYRELLRLKVDVHDRVQLTSLINADGHPGGRVVGAMGINTRTGEFYVFHARAVVLCTSYPTRNWNFNLEVTGAGDLHEINNSGDGHAAAWRAGAEFVEMERAWPILAGTGYVPYGVGNAHNSWHGTPIVDAQGREVPWYGISGQELRSVDERFVPGAGEPFMLGHGLGAEVPNVGGRTPNLAPDLPARLAKGEFSLPLFADLTRLPESERRAIFSVMVGNEGKTRTPVYKMLTRAGFDPEKDMLQVPLLPIESYNYSCLWMGRIDPHGMRNIAGGGLLVDWDLRTSLEGLYAAGTSVYGYGSHAAAASTGRYAGRRAAQDALQIGQRSTVDPALIEAEKKRVYAPLNQKQRIGWKELNAAISRVMLDYCGETKTEATLRAGLGILKDLSATEGAAVFAANPHELGRAVECQSVIETSELIMESSLVRKSSCPTRFFFVRQDYPEPNPQGERLQPIRQIDGDVMARELPLDYHRQAPFASNYDENYRQHCGLEARGTSS